MTDIRLVAIRSSRHSEWYILGVFFPFLSFFVFCIYFPWSYFHLDTKHDIYSEKKSQKRVVAQSQTDWSDSVLFFFGTIIKVPL